jgi:hydroxyquinol 1,2-dioxygenase
MLNLDEHTITGEVFRRIEATPNARLKEIMTNLIGHLHDFARETRLTEEEWLAGIMFLTRTGHTSTGTRQEFILLSDALGLSQLVVAQNHSRPGGATEQTVFGPFHIENAPDKPSHGADVAPEVVGDPLFVTARVADASGRPVANATIDMWQADAEGFYDIQHEGWTLENARLRGVFQTDSAGCISFWSIMPASYPIPMDGPVGEMMRATARHPMRPAHIHFMIRKPGFDPLVTHVFVDGDEWLDSDAVFGVRSSCIGSYLRHPSGRAPDGRTVEGPFYTLDYNFVLHPANA